MKQITEFMGVNNMKKWNNPELMVLGVENTEDNCFDYAGAIASDNDNNIHFCHKLDEYHENHGNGNGDGHIRNGKCPVENHPHWQGPGGSNCCCLPS